MKVLKCGEWRIEMKLLSATVFSCLALASAFCQPAANVTSFEAVALKRPVGTNGSSWNIQASGALILRNVSVLSLVDFAFYRPGELPPEQVPDWLSSERLDLVAKAPAKSSRFALSLHANVAVAGQHLP